MRRRRPQRQEVVLRSRWGPVRAQLLTRGQLRRLHKECAEANLGKAAIPGVSTPEEARQALMAEKTLSWALIDPPLRDLEGRCTPDDAQHLADLATRIRNWSMRASSGSDP